MATKSALRFNPEHIAELRRQALVLVDRLDALPALESSVAHERAVHEVVDHMARFRGKKTLQGESVAFTPTTIITERSPE